MLHRRVLVAPRPRLLPSVTLLPGYTWDIDFSVFMAPLSESGPWANAWVQKANKGVYFEADTTDGETLVLTPGVPYIADRSTDITQVRAILAAPPPGKKVYMDDGGLIREEWR